MTKIELPIEKEDNDIVSPLKPDFKWLWKMIFTIIIIIITLYLSVLIFSKFFIEKISIEKEKEVFGSWLLKWDEEVFDKKVLWENLWELENYKIYISNDNIPNAYASLWANIFVTKWLLEKIKTKEELLFILWHELAHIKNRDVIRWFSKTMPFIMFLDFLGLNFWNWWIDSSTVISNYFSREAERNADKWWIDYINSLKLNWVCANNFFKELSQNDNKYLEFTRSHPIDSERIKFIEKNSLYKEKKCNEFKYNKN